MFRIFRIIVAQFVFLLVLFFIVRGIFLGVYWELYKELPFTEIALSFFVGLRFDLSVLCKIFGTINLVLFLPAYFRNKSPFLWFFSLIGYCFSATLLFIQIIDISYYRVVGRRISFELFTMWNDFDAMVQFVLENQKLELFGASILLSLLAWFWFRMWGKLVKIEPPRATSKIGVGVSLFFYLVIMVIGARGGFQAKPILESFAFRGPILVLGHLSLNAPFTVMRQFTAGQVRKVKWISKKEAHQQTRNLLTTPEKTTFPKKDFTFYRQDKKTHSKKTLGKNYNVVFIILESWPAHSIGVLGSKVKGTTPRFDELSKKSRLYTRFFSNGTRSIEGIASSLTSIAALPDIALIMSGFEQNAMSSLAHTLTKKGYSSIFLHGNFRGSFGLHEFAKKIGFQKVIAKEDFKDYDKKWDGTWGIWDHIQLERFKKEFDQAKKPFFGVLFSSSSHEPFVVPNKKFNHFTSKTKDHLWLNALRYSDSALGHFFDISKNASWYKNTIFVVTADHTISGRADRTMDAARIPLLIFTPSGAILPKIDSRVGTQVDIIPTIMDFLGVEEPHNSMGKSLISENSKDRFGLFSSGTLTWFRGKYVYQFSRKTLLGIYDFEKDWNFKHPIKDTQSALHQKHIKEYLSYLQSANNAIVENRLAPNQ
ncbi:MAG: phosphoglycerol transferase MdoB-like AlkP superfamily enzyme [bacterium]|jgi:phosphoglycerol transferase MdoB-like AlkP superfamily enzyme